MESVAQDYYVNTDGLNLRSQPDPGSRRNIITVLYRLHPGNENLRHRPDQAGVHIHRSRRYDRPKSLETQAGRAGFFDYLLQVALIW